MGRLNVLLYGPKKIGKSTMAADAPKALFVATEPGLEFLDVFKVDIETWEDFSQVVQLLREGKHDFSTLVLDTLDNLYEMCSDYVCRRATQRAIQQGHRIRIEHPTDIEGWGKGYGMVNKEFKRALAKVGQLPGISLFMISHSKDKRIKVKGREIQKAVPTLPDTARDIALGMVDVILFADFDVDPENHGETRVLRTQPSTWWEAGCRGPKDMPTLPPTIDLSWEALEEAYQATMKKRKKS